jgi:two-component system LytT family sensor kinase
MSRNKIYWLCQIIGWSIYGLANIIIYSFQSNKLDTRDIIGQLMQISFYIASTHLLRFLIKRGNWLSISSLKLIPIVLTADLVLAIFNYSFLLLVTFNLGTLIPSVEMRSVNIIFGILGPLTIYFLWSLTYFTYHYFEQYNKSLKYEAVINEIELNYLKSQLNPHFIFNALNSIRGLVDENPDKSKSAINQLSNILRNSLQMDKNRLVLLSEEMETVLDYLALEGVRYEERLRVEMDISQNAYTVLVPPMMIQTLVENGIKHGISTLKKGGIISIEGKVYDGELMINIRNTGKYISGKKNEGHGLSNTIKRLDLIFGERASMDIQNESNGIVLTQLKVPANWEL